jgi:hypothetical protein
VVLLILIISGSIYYYYLPKFKQGIINLTSLTFPDKVAGVSKSAPKIEQIKSNKIPKNVIQNGKQSLISVME